MELSGCNRMKVKSKAFAIPNLTASVFMMLSMIAARVGIANALELRFAL